MTKNLILKQLISFLFQPILGVSKHLCGAATDLALTCLANAKGHVRISGVLIALCCHHRCSWGCFVGRNFLESPNVKFEKADFSLLKCLTSWGTCGTGKPREDRDEKNRTANEEKTTENPHDLRYDRLDLPRERREQIGRKTKRLLDYARAKYVQEKLDLEVQLFYYCKPEISLENVLLIAK